MTAIYVLAVIRPQATEKYTDYFLASDKVQAQVVSSLEQASTVLATPDARLDILVVDNELDNSHDYIREVRESHPRLLIILVDEGADFCLPGRADDVSTEPLVDDDLVKRMQRLVQERQTETLRADSLPPVREIAQKLRQANGVIGKAEVATTAIQELGFDLAAYYRANDDSSTLILNTAAGPPALTSITPEQQNEDTLVGWVWQNNQYRIVSPDDATNFILVKRERLGTAACLPVGSTTRFGVMLAGRERPESIAQQDIMLLNLICAQLAAALSRESTL